MPTGYNGQVSTPPNGTVPRRWLPCSTAKRPPPKPPIKPANCSSSAVATHCPFSLFALQRTPQLFPCISAYFIFVLVFSLIFSSTVLFLLFEPDKQPIMIDQAIRLSKRMMDPERPPQPGTSYELPWWTALVILANFIIFLPFVIYVRTMAPVYLFR
jgi:hypothetical protein